MTSTLYDFIPILIQIVFALLFVVATLWVSSLIGPKRRSAQKEKNFECGLDPIGNARTPFAIKYFLVAILFVIFDIEIIFMYPWAINFRALGLMGLLKMGGFVTMVGIGFIYIWKRKALDWER